MNIVIYFGTEAGMAELAASDIADAIGDEATVTVVDMLDGDLSGLTDADLTLIVCSTHGEGELPGGAEPFAEVLDADRPDLSGVRYAVFGLGDSSYPVYSRGSELIDERLAALGAERIGEFGRHDASSRDEASTVAVAWAAGVLDSVAVQA